jgi:hypothetical protein
LRKLLATLIIGAFSLIGATGVVMSTASAGGVPSQASLPPDQIVLVGACFDIGTMAHADQMAVTHYELNGPPAGVWVNKDWQPAGDFPNHFAKFFCVIVAPVPPPSYPPGVPTPPTAPPTTAATTTTTPTVSTLPSTPTTAPESPCTGLDDCHVICTNAAGVDECNICIGNNDCNVIECPVGFTLETDGDCVPVPPIATTTTTEAPTTTVPVPVTRCVIVRRVQICTLPGETSTTVEQTTTTVHIYPTTSTTAEVHPTTTTTVAPTTTTAPPTVTTLPSEGPCDGIDDCHVVCHNGSGVDECNICIGNQDCDAVICPVGDIVDGNGDCVAVPAQLPVTTTTEAPTTTVAPTTTSEPHHNKY